MRGWAQGKPGADRLRESGGFAGIVQAAPPSLPTPPPHRYPPLSWSSSFSSSSLSPLRHSSYTRKRERGRRQRGGEHRLLGQFLQLGSRGGFSSSALSLTFLLGQDSSVLGLLVCSASFPLSDVLSQWPPSPKTKAITSTLTRVAAARQSHCSVPTRPAACFLLHCYHSGLSLCPLLGLATSPQLICHRRAASDVQPFLLTTSVILKLPLKYLDYAADRSNPPVSQLSWELAVPSLRPMFFQHTVPEKKGGARCWPLASQEVGK